MWNHHYFWEESKMKNITRILAFILCLVMMLSVFAACGTDNSDKTSDDKSTDNSGDTSADDKSSEGGDAASTDLEPCTLVWIGAGWNQNDKAKKLISMWNEKYPDVKIEYTELSTLVDENYLKNLDTMIAGGETIDVTYLGGSDAMNRAINGAFVSMNEYIDLFGDDFNALFGTGATGSVSYKGEIVGIPYARNTFKVFYNKTVTDAAGITIPDSWTYEEFTDIAKKLATDDMYGCIFPFTWEDLCYAPAEVAGWDLVKVADDGTIKANFDDPILKMTMEWEKELGDDHTAPSLATLKSESTHRRMSLATGQTAMIVDGPYTLTWLNNYMWNDPAEGPLDFELGVTEMPYMTDEAANVSFETLTGAFNMPKTAAHPKEAYAFMKFVCTEGASVGNYMPSYLEADLDTAVTAFTTFTDKNGVTHEDVFPVDICPKAVSVPNESHLGYWNSDPLLATERSLMYVLWCEQYSLFLNGEMEWDEFATYINDLGNEQLATAAE
mgnify:CR=1 FL=1